MANTQEDFKRVIEYFERFDYDAMIHAREFGTEHPLDFRITEQDCFSALRVLTRTRGCPADFNQDYYRLLLEKLTIYSAICNEIAAGIVGRINRRY